MSVWSSTIVGGFDFLVDTGSDITALTTIAFKRFRFKHRNVGRRVQAMGGIAANAPTYKFDPAVKMQALDLAGQVRTFSGFQLYAMETNDQIPCILGRDFLSQYSLSVFYDPKQRLIILEGPEPQPAL
jgi:hypothetical protein